MDCQVALDIGAEGGDARIVHKIQCRRQSHDVAHILDQAVAKRMLHLAAGAAPEQTKPRCHARNRFLQSIEQRPHRVIHCPAQSLLGVAPHGSDFVAGQIDAEVLGARDWKIGELDAEPLFQAACWRKIGLRISVADEADAILQRMQGAFA